MPYGQFDTSQLRLLPLSERVHDFARECLVALGADSPPFDDSRLDTLAERIHAARAGGRAAIVAVGAHVLKVGLSLYLIDMIQRGWLSLLAMNGAGIIHDYEMALIGATTESVARYIKEGQFGLWQETGHINDLARRAVDERIGLGECVGREIAMGDYPHKDISVLAAAYEAGIPVTAHVGIGYDIIHEHPNCDGAAIGQASYNDFLVFTEEATKLDGGAYLSYGSAVMGAEVYLKALAMARNVAHQEGRAIRDIMSAVFDLVELGEDLGTEAPKSDPRYYYRPFKTVLVRTVADGGQGFYFRGDHVATLPALWRRLVARSET